MRELYGGAVAEKLCVFCKNLDFDANQGGAYPDPPNFSCRKRVWNLDFYGNLNDFRAMILTAETCPEYDEAKP